MRICIPTENEDGLRSRVSDHFGKAPYHLVFENGALCARSARAERDAEGCAPIDWMLSQSVAAVVCHSMGDGARKRLAAAGIRAFVSTETRVEKALKALEAGSARLFHDDDLCDHHHDHDHEHKPSA
jgi:predicted Fe-Mo cluster-binding NifX family protein